MYRTIPHRFPYSSFNLSKAVINSCSGWFEQSVSFNKFAVLNNWKTYSSCWEVGPNKKISYLRPIHELHVLAYLEPLFHTSCAKLFGESWQTQCFAKRSSLCEAKRIQACARCKSLRWDPHSSLTNIVQLFQMMPSIMDSF